MMLYHITYRQADIHPASELWRAASGPEHPLLNFERAYVRPGGKSLVLGEPWISRYLIDGFPSSAMMI